MYSHPQPTTIEQNDMPQPTHRENSPSNSHLPSERSEQFGRRLAIAIEVRNWDRCQDILRQAQDERGFVADPLDLAVAELPLDMRLVSGLEEMGVLMVRDLVELEPAAILAQRNFGQLSVRAIQHALRQVGLGRRNSTCATGGSVR